MTYFPVIEGSSLPAISETTKGGVPATGTPSGKYLKDNGSWTAVPSVEAFPIGSVFIAVVSTSPATLLGYGTWSAFGAGRVLVGLNSGDADFDTVEETGGAKTVSAGTPAGTIDAHTVDNQSTAGSAPKFLTGPTTHTFTGSALTATSVVQPYIVVYIWKRTA